MPARLDIPFGTKFNRLTFLQDTGRSHAADRGRNRSIGLFLCDCGRGVEKQTYLVKRGHTQNCDGHTCPLLRNKYRWARREQYASMISTMRYQYFKLAKDKGREFTISDDEFVALVFSHCHYCGSPPSNRWNPPKKMGHKVLIYNGIDRVDNSKGYVAGNVVPCCINCNRGKRTMTREAFLSWVKSVHDHSLQHI